MFKFYKTFLNKYDMDESEKQKVVIVGNGWGTRWILSSLDTNKFKIKIISEENYFSYTPLLAQSIDPEMNNNITKIDINKTPFKKYYMNGKVLDFNNDKKYVIIEKENKKSVNIKYDYIIFSHGSSINFFNINGLEENVKDNIYVLKNHNDMIKLKDKINLLPNKSNIAIMGCGPTGVEIIGSLIDRPFKKFNIFAIDGMERPISFFNRHLSNVILNIWNKNKINVHMNSFVKKVDNTVIYCNDNTKIKYDLGIWCGGVKNTTLTDTIINKYQNKLHNKRSSGIFVNDFLQIKINKTINSNDNNTINSAFAIGDCNMTCFPKTAQVAYQQGVYVGNYINNPNNKSPFYFTDFGQFCYIGNNTSIYHGPYFQKSSYVINLFNSLVQSYNLFKTKYF